MQINYYLSHNLMMTTMMMMMMIVLTHVITGTLKSRNWTSWDLTTRDHIARADIARPDIVAPDSRGRQRQTWQRGWKPISFQSHFSDISRTLL